MLRSRNKENANPGAPPPAATAADPAVDLAKIEATGHDVVSAMQSVRELLEARAQVLESCRKALEEYANRLTSEARNRDSARANASESEKRSSRDLASARMTIRSNAAGIGCGAAALGGNGTSVACARKSSGSLRYWSNGPRPTTIR